MCQHGVFLANKYQKKLVSNFAFSPYALAELARIMGCYWFLDNMGNGIVSYIDSNSAFEDILCVPDSVVLIDEVALYAPRRAGGTPQTIRNALAMSGKLSQFIILSCQFPSQIDEGLKEYVDDIFYANGLFKWDSTIRNYKLFYKNVKAFSNENFRVWFADPKLRRNPLKTRLLSFKQWAGPLNCVDAVAFDAYNSFVDFRNFELATPPDFSCSLALKSLDYYPISLFSVRSSSQSQHNDDYDDDNDDAYSKLQTGQLPLTREANRKNARIRNSDTASQQPIQRCAVTVWTLFGRHHIKLHQYSKFMPFFYSALPASSYLKIRKSEKFMLSMTQFHFLLIKGVCFYALFILAFPFFVKLLFKV